MKYTMLETLSEQQHFMNAGRYHRKTKSEVPIIKHEEDNSTNQNPYFGNKFIRRQYYGSMEVLPATDDPSTPMLRKASRFRVEPSEDVKFTQLIARSPSLAKLENPEFQTRWYFKFFLGQVHNNYVFMDLNKEMLALSVCLTDVENHGIPQYRAILWQKSGCRRICFPFVPNKHVNAREVLRLFAIDKIEKTPKEIVAPEVQKELLVLEEQEGSVNFKFGVIYAKQGQSTDDEMFGNVSGSEEFDKFLHVLGDIVELKGWTGYRGGLDVKDNMTGQHSLYTMFEGHEVMFHVSTLLPYSKDTQQVERKRHIGNDIAVIVFVDGEPDDELAFKPSSIRTKFTHVFAVIRYSKKTKSYWLSVYSEENVPPYGPPLPIPARFVNPHEFRSFLITKLMNGEKAAYVSPVFSHKRQRTLESLIGGLQKDNWAKPEKFGLKRAMSEINSKERRRAFLEVGQALKVNKIMQGHAPTSVANVGGLLAVKNTPWEPHAILSNFTRKIICGDSYGNSLIVSCDQGIFHITDEGARRVLDNSMIALQLTVLENYGIVVMRLRKHGRLYVIPLSEIEIERPFTYNRRNCAKYYVKKSKGSHLYAISRQESPFLALAIAVGKRISLYCWKESSIWYSNDKSSKVEAPPAGFAMETEKGTSQDVDVKNQVHVTFHRKKVPSKDTNVKIQDFLVNEAPRTLTIVHDKNDELLICLGLRHRFDVINAQSKEVSVLKNIVNYRKPKIVSALDIFDDNNPEILLTYSRTSVFVCLRQGLSEIVSFHWNSAPLNIVCAFPFILGFSENSIEIRLMVNGNLVHTHCVPGLQLLTAKSDIYFLSVVSTASPAGSISRRSSTRNYSLTHAQSFLKIGLSDLAGLNAVTEDEQHDIEHALSRRNVAVYESHNYKKNMINNRLGVNGLLPRTYSASAALCAPVITDIQDMGDEVMRRGETISTPKTDTFSKTQSTENISKEQKDAFPLKNASSAEVLSVDFSKSSRVNKPPNDEATQNHLDKSRSLPVSPVKSPMGHQSFFYTPQKHSVKYEDIPENTLSRKQNSTSRERIEKKGADFIKRRASLKSLPDDLDEKIEALNNTSKPRRSTSIKYEETTWDLTVSHSQTLPHPKKKNTNV